MDLTTVLQIDLPALTGASLAALSCAYVGNFLVLTRQAMMSDALSHVMLPGVLVAFLITGSAATLPVLAGGVGAGLVAVALIGFLVRAGGVDPSAALGIVFTTLFAAGIVLLEQSGAARTSFDVHHVLYGNLEGLVWPAATDLRSLVDPDVLADLPPALGRMTLVLILVTLPLALFQKELALVAFDRTFAAASGLPTRRLDMLLLVAAALAAVAAFETVGAILAIAMVVCPPAAARLMTDRLSRQIGLSLVIALASTLIGYGLAAFGPGLLGFDLSINAASMIGLVSVMVLAGAAMRPTRGVRRDIKRFPPVERA